MYKYIIWHSWIFCPKFRHYSSMYSL